MQTQQRHGLRASHARPPPLSHIFSFAFLLFLTSVLLASSIFPSRQHLSIHRDEAGYLRHTPLPSSLTTSDSLSSQMVWDSKALLTPRDEIPAAITGNKRLPISPFPLPIRSDLFPLFCLSGCLGLSHRRCGFMNGNQYPFRHKAKHSLLCNYRSVMSP